MKATINNKLSLLNDKEEILCNIECITYYDEDNEFDEGETFYIHPLTGSECQTIGICLQGWSELDSKEQANWDALIEKIKSDSVLSQKLFMMDNIEYYV